MEHGFFYFINQNLFRIFEICHFLQLSLGCCLGFDGSGRIWQGHTRSRCHRGSAGPTHSAVHALHVQVSCAKCTTLDTRLPGHSAKCALLPTALSCLMGQFTRTVLMIDVTIHEICHSAVDLHSNIASELFCSCKNSETLWKSRTV